MEITRELLIFRAKRLIDLATQRNIKIYGDPLALLQTAREIKETTKKIKDQAWKDYFQINAAGAHGHYIGSQEVAIAVRAAICDPNLETANKTIDHQFIRLGIKDEEQAVHDSKELNCPLTGDGA